jgi:hypothetical protein
MVGEGVGGSYKCNGNPLQSNFSLLLARREYFTNSVQTAFNDPPLCQNLKTCPGPTIHTAVIAIKPTKNLMHGWHDVILHYAKYAASVNLAHFFRKPITLFRTPTSSGPCAPTILLRHVAGCKKQGTSDSSNRITSIPSFVKIWQVVHKMKHMTHKQTAW